MASFTVNPTDSCTGQLWHLDSSRSLRCCAPSIRVCFHLRLPKASIPSRALDASIRNKYRTTFEQYNSVEACKRRQALHPAAAQAVDALWAYGTRQRCTCGRSCSFLVRADELPKRSGFRWRSSYARLLQSDTITSAPSRL